MTDRVQYMAQWMWDARQRRLPYANLPEVLTPASIAEACAAQEIYYRLAEPVYGAVGGAKIATTTRKGDAGPDGHQIMPAAARCLPAPSMPRRRKSRPRISSTCASKAKLRYKLGADFQPARGARQGRAKRSTPAVAGAMPAFETDRGPQCRLRKDCRHIARRRELLERRRGDRRGQGNAAQRPDRHWRPLGD